jgi:hypothetical protein
MSFLGTKFLSQPGQQAALLLNLLMNKQSLSSRLVP